jgi:TerC family integral membrane protein
MMQRTFTVCAILFAAVDNTVVAERISSKRDWSWNSQCIRRHAKSQDVTRGGMVKRRRKDSLERFGRIPFLTNNSLKSEAHMSKTQKQSSKEITPEEEYKIALTKTILTVSAAVIFGIGLMAVKGPSSGYEFFAGYLIEQSLSIDNLFVFIMLFEYFRVPMELQDRVLSWGIGGAIALRGIMIGVGVAALQKFKSIILVFAGILIASSVNLLLEKEGHGQVENEDGNIIMKLAKFLFPNTSSELHGERFFIKGENGKRIATPLFLCLICVELSDFVFAVDSIPAVLGVSKDPLVVYASNIFAILALRSLYTVVAKAVSSFHYLKPAVAIVLGFVGTKMVAEYFHIEISIATSLTVICSVLGGGIIASIMKNESLKQVEDSTFGEPFVNVTMTL